MMFGAWMTTSSHPSNDLFIRNPWQRHGVVIGAIIAGLTAALYAVTAGHHVVVLDRTDRLGGVRRRRPLTVRPLATASICSTSAVH